MKNKIQFILFSLFLLLILSNKSILADCDYNIWGIVKLDNQVFQGARVYVRYTYYDGTTRRSDIAISRSDGSYTVALCNFPWQSEAWKKDVIAEYPNTCPVPNNVNQNFVGVNLTYNFNNTTPSGSGNYSGVINVNGNPAPYHTKITFAGVSGYAQTTDNTGSFNSPTSFPLGSQHITVTVYTQPNITTRLIDFCFNTVNEIVNINTGIDNYEDGYITGTLNNGCNPIADQLVYYYPSTNNGMAEGWVYTDANGNFTTNNLPVGSYVFTSTYNGILRSKTVTIHAGLNAGQYLQFGNNCTGGELTLTALIEGFYNGSTMISDTVTAELHNATSPYELFESKKGVLNNNGVGTFNFTTVIHGTPYYIVGKNRSAIETWSSYPQTFTTNSLNYDFTSSQNQAYGGNQFENGSKWCFYSGDVNQDGSVDLYDLSIVETDKGNFVNGYVPSDLNGDGSIDIFDLSIVNNNINNFIGKIIPGGAPTIKLTH